MTAAPTDEDFVDELIQDAMGFGADDPAPWGHVAESRRKVLARMAGPTPHPGDRRTDMSTASAVRLGQRVRDVTTGLEGVAESLAHTLHGNRRVCVQPPAAEGKLPESVWVDDVGLDVVDAAAFTARVVQTLGVAGPWSFGFDP